MRFFCIACPVGPAALPGDSGVIDFPRYTEYGIATTVVPPDTLVAACRGSELALYFSGFPAAILPSSAA